jgi:hypothetical protein
MRFKIPLSTGADQKPSLTAPTLHLFNCACTYLTSIHDSKKFLSNSRTHTNTTPISASPTLPYAGHHRGKYHSLEQAAAASVSSSSTTPASAAAYASKPVSPFVPSGRTPPTNPYHQEGKTIYIKAIRALAAPVTGAANVYFQHHHNGPLKRYLAVPTAHDICSNCFPSDAATPATNPCQPSCTSRLCTRCNYYYMVPANTHSFRGDHTTFSLRVLRGAQELTTAVSCR